MRLRHIRVGGKVFTTAVWIAEFGAQLAVADAVYFDSQATAAKRQPPRDAKYAPPSRRRSAATPPPGRDPARDEDLERELNAEGL